MDRVYRSHETPRFLTQHMSVLFTHLASLITDKKETRKRSKTIFTARVTEQIHQPVDFSFPKSDGLFRLKKENIVGCHSLTLLSVHAVTLSVTVLDNHTRTEAAQWKVAEFEGKHI